MCLCSAQQRNAVEETWMWKRLAHTHSHWLYGCYIPLISSSQRDNKSKTHLHGNHFSVASIPANKWKWMKKRRSGREINTLIYYLEFKMVKECGAAGAIRKWDSGVSMAKIAKAIAITQHTYSESICFIWRYWLFVWIQSWTKRECRASEEAGASVKKVEPFLAAFSFVFFSLLLRFLITTRKKRREKGTNIREKLVRFIFEMEKRTTTTTTAQPWKTSMHASWKLQS